MGKGENYFDHDADIGIIGRGETIENCFCDTAKALFNLMIAVSNVHLIQIITFEFEEENLELALLAWLNLLIAKAHEHHLILGDFRLKREGNMWKATVSGEPRGEYHERKIEVKAATLAMLSVKKVDHVWEARCVIEV
jgi:SHS2 domain-containing protein